MTNYRLEPCPRCLRGDVARDEDGTSVSALSRADNSTDVCDLCGADEAFRWSWDDEVVPVHEWPTDRKYDFRGQPA